ncbi:MAG: glycosyltransferase [Gemmatimonadota bacterium]
MKVLHVVYGWRPDAMGGTEVYVAGLAAALARLDVASVIAAPGDDSEVESDQGPLQVYRYRAPPPRLQDLYGHVNTTADEHFAAIVRTEAPDVVHFHAFSPAVTPVMAAGAAERGAVVLTYHTPTVTCQRGSLRRWGRIPCDGELRPRRCAACALQGGGAPLPLALLAASAPAVLSRAVDAVGRSGGGWTALRMPALLEARRRALRAFLAAADAVVAPVPWAVDVLVRNGVPAARISVISQGVRDHALAVADDRAAAGPARAPDHAAELRMAFLGRLDPLKGAHVLVEALARVPRAGVTLDVFGLPTGATDYVERLNAAAAADPRVRMAPPVGADGVLSLLGDYDLIVVPSQGAETGPLVVLEAQAAGVPVLGSAVGGIADRVEDGRDGRLVADFQTPAAWARAIAHLAADPARLAQLRAGQRPPPTMTDAAARMAELYRTVLARRN